MAITRAHFKELRELGRKKGRREQALFLVEGMRLIEEAMHAGAEFTEVLHTAEFVSRAGGEQLLRTLEERRVPLHEVGKREMAALADTVTAQGIAGVVRIRQARAHDLFAPPPAPSLLVALDAVADPGNVGTILRTCDWFGVQGVLLGRASVELMNPKLVRGSMGSLFRLRVASDVDLPAVLPPAKRQGYTIVAADAGGRARYDRFTFPSRCILVLGNEAHGVSVGLLEQANQTLAIPRYGHGESLNVAITCGILLAASRSSMHP